MTDIKALLDGCPYMAGYHVDDLPPGLEAAVFPQGVVESKQDILGNRTVKKRYVLQKRCVRGDTWGEDMAAWLLRQGVAVTGGKLATPASDGAGVYELQVEITA